MLVVVSDERAVFGELLVAQFTDVRRPTAAGPLMMSARCRRRCGLVEAQRPGSVVVLVLGKGLGRAPALPRAASARHDRLLLHGRLQSKKCNRGASKVATNSVITAQPIGVRANFGGGLDRFCPKNMGQRPKNELQN